MNNGRHVLVGMIVSGIVSFSIGMAMPWHRVEVEKVQVDVVKSDEACAKKGGVLVMHMVDHVNGQIVDGQVFMFMRCVVPQHQVEI